ncbi:MAG: SipW-dependent-type signal peptide-containing protein [Oscillospiraceae bacterium]|nr:SipW-dependent-type signal peptide-containing protein [Oscillospiraceae bacterium]
MTNKIKRKPLILTGAIALTVLLVLASTFAWFTANDSVKNKLATKEGLAKIKIQEVFVEPDDWKPGQTITKEVSVINPGSAPALIRVSFMELLKVNLPPIGESTIFDQTKEDYGRRPSVIDNSLYSGADWFEVTTTANVSKGGIKLANDYFPVKVFAKYSDSGSNGSYSFAAWAPISGTSYDGLLQEVTYDRGWDSAEKMLTLTNIKYITYQGIVSAGADWSVDKPLTADINKSVAETIINTSLLPQYADTNGNYPNYIQLNYDNLTSVPTNGKWFYNADDGYFYYIGLAESGTVTPNILASLLLNGEADGDYYSNLVFELTVNLNAIQNTTDAVASLWTGATGDLKTALDALCES